LLAAKNADIAITVQITPDHYGKYDDATRADIARLETTSYAPLTLIRKNASPEEYAATFPGSICLQPYDAAEFRDRVSGVTLDALGARLSHRRHCRDLDRSADCAAQCRHRSVRSERRKSACCSVRASCRLFGVSPSGAGAAEAREGSSWQAVSRSAARLKQGCHNATLCCTQQAFLTGNV
jgi:hypothetical protein